MKTKLKDYKVYFFILFLLIIAYISYLIVSPYITPIVLSTVIAYIFYPLYKKVNLVIKNRSVASVVLAIGIIILFSIPLIYIAKNTTQEVLVTYLLVKQKLGTGFDSATCADVNNTLCQGANAIHDFLAVPKNLYYIQSGLEKVQAYALQFGTKLIVSIPRIVVNLFITFFILFFLFKDGAELIERIKSLAPLKRKHKKRIFKKLHESLNATIFGTMITALIQGCIAGIGYYFFGVTSPIMWGLMTAFVAFIPMLGTSLVWLPMGIYTLLTGYLDGNSTDIGRGIGILAFGALIVSLVDNFIRPKIIGDRANVHPVLILVGVLGGISLLGIVGIIIGPIVLTLLITFIKIYEEETKEVD